MRFHFESGCFLSQYTAGANRQNVSTNITNGRSTKARNIDDIEVTL